MCSFHVACPDSTVKTVGRLLAIATASSTVRTGDRQTAEDLVTAYFHLWSDIANIVVVCSFLSPVHLPGGSLLPVSTLLPHLRRPSLSLRLSLAGSWRLVDHAG